MIANHRGATAICRIRDVPPVAPNSAMIKRKPPSMCEQREILRITHIKP